MLVGMLAGAAFNGTYYAVAATVIPVLHRADAAWRGAIPVRHLDDALASRWACQSSRTTADFKRLGGGWCFGATTCFHSQ